TEAWHKKAYHDIKNRVLRALSVGGVFFRNGKTIDGMDWYETSVTAVPANQYSIFALAQGKGLNFKDCTAWDNSERGTTTSAGAEAVKPAAAAAPTVSRAIHTHANGVNHAHAGGTKPHTHGMHKHSDGGQHKHGVAVFGHTHEGMGPSVQHKAK